MDINSALTNGIPENVQVLTPEQLKEYRLAYGYYLSPATILRLLEPLAYFTGIVWEYEELLKCRCHNLKSNNRYCGNINVMHGNHSEIEAEQMRQSEKDCLEEERIAEYLNLDIIKQLFLQWRQGNDVVSDSRSDMYNAGISLSSTAEFQKTDTIRTLANIDQPLNQLSVHNDMTGVINCEEVPKHKGEQHIVVKEGAYQDNLKCGEGASEEGTQQSSCNSATTNSYNLCCCDIGTDGIISDSHNGYNRCTHRNKITESARTSRSLNEYAVGLPQNTNNTNEEISKEQCNLSEQPNLILMGGKNEMISWAQELMKKGNTIGSSAASHISEDNTKDISYVVHEIYEAPVLHHSSPINGESYNNSETRAGLQNYKSIQEIQSPKNIHLKNEGNSETECPVDRQEKKNIMINTCTQSNNSVMIYNGAGMHLLKMSADDKQEFLSALALTDCTLEHST